MAAASLRGCSLSSLYFWLTVVSRPAGYAPAAGNLELSDTREKPKVCQLPRLSYILSSGQMAGNGSVVNLNAFFIRPPDEVTGGFARDFKVLF